MSYRKLIESYYVDVNNVADLMSKLVTNYRALIGSANDLNGIALAKRKDVKHALDRANELGRVIDTVIEVLEKTSAEYLGYCDLKAEYLKCKQEPHHVQHEIEEILKAD